VDGVLLGTAAYMSPEQARGQSVDKRTDVWAFGCLLYEMLTGRALFGRPTISDTIAAVIEREPEWSALPPSVPTPVRRLMRRCLQKDPRQRFRDIGDVRMAIDEALTSPADDGGEGPARARGPQAFRSVLGAAVLVALGSVVVSVWALSNRRDDVAATVTRTTVILPSNAELDAGQTTAPLALSPDGRQLAFVAGSEGRTRLHLRAFDTFTTKPIEGTDGAQYPFFSPDGAWVAFFADEKLKRVSIAGGAPVPICDAPAFGRGGTWGGDGMIVFARASSGLLMVPAAGGKPEPVASRDAAVDARFHAWPQFLPDGQHLLSTVTGLVAENQSALAVLSLKDRSWHVLGPGSQAQYLSPGYLVYHDTNAREGQLSAVPFDPGTATLRGTPISVLDGVFRAANNGAAFFALAQTGALVFAPGGFARGLVFVDRQGRRTPLTNERQGFRFPRFSPDGRKVAVDVDPRPSQLFIYDVDRASRMPLSNGGITPVWTPDGQRVAFSFRGGISWKPADGSRAEEQLLEVGRPANPTSWSADGRVLIFQEDDPVTQYDIWVSPRGEKPRPLIATPSREMGGRLSPDGRWLAYYSNESGRNEVYVRPFPNVNEQRWTVSTAGGQSPAWSPDGRELFYMNAAAMMAVSIQTRGPSLAAGTPEFLFDGPFDTTQDMNFDVSPDGTRFVMVEADPDASPTRLQVVLNWPAELKEKVSTK
jgi:Tol biopolymer transport system component